MMVISEPIDKHHYPYGVSNSLAQMCRTFVEFQGAREVAGNATITIAFGVNKLVPLFAIIRLFTTCELGIPVCRTFIPTLV